jgi:TolB protein
MSTLMNFRYLFLIIIIFACHSFSNLVLGAEVQVEINSTEAKKIDIAIPLFTCSQAGNEALLEEIKQIFSQDLDFSGRFNVVDISGFAPAGSTEIVTPDFKAWYLVGIQALITGHIVPGDKDLEINMRLFDVPMGQQVVGIRYQVPPPKIRAVVHKFADEIQYQLTGERGINFSKIAFVSNRSGNQELYMVDPDGGDLVQITRNGSINMSPCWSPDGSMLYCTSYISKHPDLYVLNIEDKKLKPVVKGGMNITPSLSPDGKTLAFSKSFDGDPEIVLINIESNTQKRITFTPGVDSNPSFSPNGQELAFSSDRSGNPQIFVMDIDGANVRRLTYQGAYNTAPEWSPRGDWIVYHSRLDGVFDIWMIQPNGLDEHALTGEAGQNEDPTWARDGRHIAFVSTRSGSKGLYVTDISGRLVKPIVVQHGECINPSWSR